MKKLLILAAAALTLFSCSREHGDDPIPVPPGAEGTLSVSIPGVNIVPLTYTNGLEDLELGHQNLREMTVSTLHVFLFRADDNALVPTNVGDEWKLIYSAKARDFTEQQAAEFNAIFPLFDPLALQHYGEVHESDNVFAVFVANYDVVGAYGGQSGWDTYLEGMTLQDFRTLKLTPVLESGAQLDAPFVMYGEADEFIFPILDPKATTVSKVALQRLAARIDITNTLGSNIRIIEAQVVDGTTSSFLGPMATVSNATLVAGVPVPTSPAIELLDMAIIGNRGYNTTDGTVGTPGASLDSMWSHLFAYPTYNDGGIRFDPDNHDLHTPTQVRVKYEFQGNINEEFVEFYNIDTSSTDGDTDTVIPIRRNYRYEIVFAETPLGVIPVINAKAVRPWEDSIYFDSTEIEDSQLDIEFIYTSAEWAARGIDYRPGDGKYWGDSLLDIPDTAIILKAVYRSSVRGINMDYDRSTVNDWVTPSLIAGPNTYASHGAFSDTIVLTIKRNESILRDGLLVLTNGKRDYKYFLSQKGAITSLRPAANSFIVGPNDTIAFRPAAQANRDGVYRIAGNDSVKVEVLWTDVANGATGVLDTVWAEGAGLQTTFIVRRGSGSGNAVIAAKVAGKIVWSFHIWGTNYNPDEAVALAVSDGGFEEVAAGRASNGKVFRYTSVGTPDASVKLGANVFMDRNLGTTSATPGNVTAKGLLYQWGRKDPFPNNAAWTNAPEALIFAGGKAGSGFFNSGAGFGAIVNHTETDTKLANNLQYAIENPMTFITAPATPYDWYPHNEDATRSDQNDKLWGDDGDASDGYGKSIYDPCPAGWRVPINGAWHGLVNTTDTDYAFPWVAAQYGRFGDVASGGWNVTGWTWADPAQTPGGKATLGYYPADGYRSYDTGALNYVGMSGHRWLSAMYVPSPSDASYFYIGAGNLYPSYVAGRSYAFPVRCVTE